MSSMIQQNCKVESCNEAAAGTFILRFASPEIAAAAKPGQFVNVLPAKINEGPLLRRPLSISRIDGNTVEFLFHVAGTGTKILSRKRQGDEIDVLGPLGQSFHINADYETALIAGGGIGVAPFPFLTAELLKSGKRIETFIGFRSAEQVYKSHLQNVHTATDDGSEGFEGNVVQLLEKFINKNTFGKAKIFACGPIVMLKALSEYAKQKIICCEMSLEGQMACGVGICQGCVVERKDAAAKYALVCKDGPAFLSTEVNL